MNNKKWLIWEKIIKMNIKTIKLENSKNTRIKYQITNK